MWKIHKGITVLEHAVISAVTQIIKYYRIDWKWHSLREIIALCVIVPVLQMAKLTQAS